MHDIVSSNKKYLYIGALNWLAVLNTETSPVSFDGKSPQMAVYVDFGGRMGAYFTPARDQGNKTYY